MSEQRRLAAILVADVVGYSKLMGSDEAGTLAQLGALRTEIIEPQIAKHAGRLFKSVGDGFFIEFASAVQAVSCAKAIQEANDLGRLPLRIGIHVGDVVVQGDDLMGDGVNVAARIEGIADTGGIAITRAVHEQVRDKLDVGFMDKGKIALKNIQRPVQVFVIGGAKVDGQATALPLPDRPSIIVLPFICPGETPEQEAIADGITESLITDLSRQSGLAVVASTTSLALKGKKMDIRELGRTMDVRYVVEGSVQLGTRRLRVNVQLISAADGIHVWADRFDRDLGDLLEVEDEVAERISRALAFQLREAEIQRAKNDNEGSLNSEALVLLGRQAFMQGACRRNCERAAALYADAVGADGGNATAHAQLSITKAILNMYRLSAKPEAELEVSIRHRDQAIALAPNLPVALVASAWVLVAQRRFAAALAAFERVARTAPLAGGNAFANVAVAKNNVGRPAEAEVELLRVIRVTPSDPQMDVWHYYLGASYLYLSRYPEAAEAFGKAISINLDFDAPYIGQAAALVQLGHIDQARVAIQQARALGTLWTVGTAKTAVHSGIGVGIDDARMTALWEGLRLAGLPE
jgi:TolB-like protein